MRYQDLHPSISYWLREVNSRLASLLTEEADTLREAGALILGSRGKRLRPILLLLAHDVFVTPADRALQFAIVVEMIHAASLAHDDVIDEASLRRGVPSAPARWGNKFSILIGDYLLARVFEIAAEDGDLRILSLLAGASAQMGRAVVLECADLSIDTSEETYLRIIEGKTASLFAASAAIGGHLGNATAAQQQALYELGFAFGCAFQLADDLMDLHGSEEEVGKPLGVDWSQRRATLPLLHALHTASPAVAAEIRALWQHEPFGAEEMCALRMLVESAGGIDYGWRQVAAYRDVACACLAALPAGAGSDGLLHLCTDAFPMPIMPAAI